MTQSASTTMSDFLQQACATVKHLENDAQAALAAGNVDVYRALMLQKAQFLVSLERSGQKYLSTLPADRQEGIADRLRGFSASATNAISVNSVFYMSALLYPEDYVQGTPNDLELFAQNVL